MQVRWKTVASALLGAAFLFGTGFLFGRYIHDGAEVSPSSGETATKYTCPMHPQIISDRPGECPICGMDLVPIKDTGGEEETGAKYTCPMHPQIISDRPGECPICGMDLVPIKDTRGEVEELESKVEGYAVVKISPRRQQLIGIRKGSVQFRLVSREIRTVGVVKEDERRLSTINTKVSGWVEKLYVRETGQLVRRGQPLLSIYSPELVATQEEYLLALRYQRRLAKSPFPEIRQSGSDLVAAARRRLLLWDIPPSEIQRVERTGRPLKTLTLYAPFHGYVLERLVTEGDHVMPGKPLLRLADLSTVWVLADIYEQDIPLITEGMPAELTTDAYPGEVFKGRVDYVYPTLEAKTRTVKVRFIFLNPQLKLKPDMYVHVTLKRPLGRRLVVPKEAVVFTGKRTLVFVAREGGLFEPREVILGPDVGEDLYVVREGLRPGEEIVVSGTFLVDSESQLRYALQLATKGEEVELPIGKGGQKPPEGEGQPSGHAGHGM